MTANWKPWHMEELVDLHSENMVVFHSKLAHVPWILNMAHRKFVDLPNLKMVIYRIVFICKRLPDQRVIHCFFFFMGDGMWMSMDMIRWDFCWDFWWDIHGL